MTYKVYIGAAVLGATSVLVGCGDSSTNVSINATDRTMR